MLGAWDSDPDNGHHRLPSERGLAILDKKIGDEVEFSARHGWHGTLPDHRSAGLGRAEAGPGAAKMKRLRLIAALVLVLARILRGGGDLREGSPLDHLPADIRQLTSWVMSGPTSVTTGRKSSFSPRSSATSTSMISPRGASPPAPIISPTTGSRALY